MAKKTVKIEGMMCEGCASSVDKALRAVPGVTSVDVNLKKGTATVEGDADDDALVRAVVDAGFRGKMKQGLFR